MSSRIRPKAWLSHHRPGTGSFKYHFNVHVHDVVLREGMVVPEGAKFRLVWKRGDKVASSREIAQASPMVFDESLSLVCTMYRDPAVGAYAEKEAAFALHMTGPRAGSATRQLARATLDLSKWAGIEAISEELKLVLLHDGVPVGDVRLTLSSRWLKSFSRVGSETDHSLVSGGSGGSADSDGSSRSLSGYGSESSFLTADSDTDAGSEASES